MNALIGRKLGMTRMFGGDGEAIPVTVIEAGPCPVVQVKTETGKPPAVQLGFGTRKAKRTTKALAGHATAAGLEAAPQVLREVCLRGTGEDAPKRGDVVTVEIFQPGDTVKVTGRTKGRGFQGVVKRHGFSGGPASHGSTRYRKPGSMGPGTDPSRVIKGKKLPGRMGNNRHTELGLSVVRVDAERNLLFVRGAVPGPTRGIVLVRKQGGRSRYA
ncbi:MAG: 50S ribosomal protein L3 [Gemmatimonadales bacterium]|nr:50S ribosomal protein L3 [Gemmatimonadales bacterium]NIN12763.1 50S ribosomal protein L3 [Gemmatimonadales bacterium]NIN50987.1 50S ribosomal protein L3 [Gemmatimonadales bacterium]NIP08451.1 50S ribosomal protein L3 [Gemmatimonadales bacterium]NIR02171.1 50S ribosomal protein L3 [Gemmatimonadales bacterium]